MQPYLERRNVTMQSQWIRGCPTSNVTGVLTRRTYGQKDTGGRQSREEGENEAMPRTSRIPSRHQEARDDPGQTLPQMQQAHHGPGGPSTGLGGHPSLRYFVTTASSSVQFSHSVVSNSLRSHEPQHARPPCPSPTPGVHPNPCPLSRQCHPTISSSVIPFSSHPQSFQHQGLFK